MAGYLLIERRFMQPDKRDGVAECGAHGVSGLSARELREEPFHFPRGHKILIEGVEDVLIAAGENRDAVASYIHDLLASRANDLYNMGGQVQIVFKWQLNQADDFWFEVGQERYSLRRIFGSPRKQVDQAGIEFYTVGFNLS